MIAGRTGLLLDTGPLVALLHQDDQDHQSCLEVFEQFRGVILTTEAVLTEATYLLARVRGAQHMCLEFFIRGGALLVPMTRRSLQRCQMLMEKYADVPMDLADATLVTLAEDTDVSDVFTLDRRGFGAYRIGRNKAFCIQP
jgi:predicted nucleic acid-binding protein